MTPEEVKLQKKIEALGKADLFSQVPYKYLETLALGSVFKTVEPETVLFEEGEEGDEMYVVISGAVFVEQLYKTGNPGNAALRKAGSVVGEMALLDASKRMATVKALEKSQLLIIRRSQFLEVLLVSPEFSLAIIKNLAGRLRESWDKIKKLQTQSIRYRVIKKLIDITEDQTWVKGSSPLILNLSNKNFANLISTNEQSLSRHFGFLEEAGVIEKTRGAVRILDLDALKNLLDSPKL